MREWPAGQTVADMLRTLNIAPGTVAVELNQQVIRRALHAETPLGDGDVLEIVQFVGGGL